MAIFSVTKQTIKTNALTAATQGIFRKRLYDELGLMSLKKDVGIINFLLHDSKWSTTILSTILYRSYISRQLLFKINISCKVKSYSVTKSFSIAIFLYCIDK